MLPCPYCGAKADLVNMNTDKENCFVPYWVQCTLCDEFPMTAEYNTKKEAINAWNNRVFEGE